MQINGINLAISTFNDFCDPIPIELMFLRDVEGITPHPDIFLCWKMQNICTFAFWLLKVKMKIRAAKYYIFNCPH